MRIISLITAFFCFFNFYSQCSISINASSTTVPCGGGTVTLTAVGGGTSTVLLDNDFDAGAAGTGWNVSPAGQFNNPCDASFDGGTYMWMGNTTAAPRTLETLPMNLSCGGEICFYLDYSTQGDLEPCEGPDLSNEGVYFEFSNDGGTTWTTIDYYDPNSGYDPTLTTWNQYCYPLPAAAQGPNTALHWFQDGSSGTCCDHWGIDNVTITAQGCSTPFYDWDNIPGTVGPTGDPASQTVTVVSDTTFTVCYTDGGAFNCCETITITVDGMSAPTITSVDETCQGDSDGSVSITANGGSPNYTFSITSGPASPANKTNPSSASFSNLPPGTYTVDVSDNGGCTVSSSFTIAAGPICCDMILSSTTTITSCNQNNGPGCDGTASVTQTLATGVVSYQWFDNAGNPIAGATNSTISGLCIGDYYVEVTDAGAPCTLTENVTIGEPSEITLTFTSTNPLCPGSEDGTANVIPTGGIVSGNYSYNWTPAGTAASSSPFAQNLGQGNYSVLVEDDNGCQQDTSFTLTEPAAESISSVDVTNASCSGTCDGIIVVNYANGVLFEINGPSGLVSNSTGTFSNLCTGTYAITAYNANNCSVTESASITSGTMNLSVSNDTIICVGGTANLVAYPTGGAGGYTYVWDNGLPSTQSNSVSPSSATIYTVYVQDANGCLSPSASITVNLNPSLTVFALSDQSICFGSNASISSFASGGNGGPYTYTWDQGLGNGQTQNVAPVSTSIYTVSVSDGCETPSASASLTITINPLPQPDFIPDTTKGCLPLQVSFEETFSSVGYTCNWFFGDGDATTQCGVVNHLYEEEGCYDVTLTMTSDQGCSNQITYSNLICTYGYPVADFDFGPQPTTYLEPTIYFNNNSTANAVDFLWQFGTNGSLGISNSVNPEFTFSNEVPGKYEVCLTAYTALGCRSDTCNTVIVNDVFVLYVPNCFTVDGDGFNEEFYPVISGYDPASFEMYIFNRWGELIWQTQDIGIKWDGSEQKSRVPAEEGVYVWKIVVKDVTSGEKKEYLGHVTLLR